MPAPSWFPDELTHAGRENLDAEHVARYDDKEDAHAASEVALLRELGLSPRSVVVEIGWPCTTSPTSGRSWRSIACTA